MTACVESSTQSIAEATAKKSALDKSVSVSAEAKKSLDETVGQAKTLGTSLSGKIEEGTQLNKDITASGQKAVDDINNASKKAIEDINATGAEKLKVMNDVAAELITDKEQIVKNKADIALLNDEKANGKGISFSINESGGLRVTYDDGK